MKKYFVMVFEKGVWREMPYPASALRDADIIAKNILATKKGVAKVAVISRNEVGKLLQTHREYSRNPAKKKVVKRVSTRAKKNPEIHIDINSHNAKRSAKAKTNPVKEKKFVIPKSFNKEVQYSLDGKEWFALWRFESEDLAAYVAKNMAKDSKWKNYFWRVVRL